MGGIGGAPASDRIPSRPGRVAYHFHSSRIDGVVANGDIVKVLGVVGGLRQLVEGRIDETQRMTCHLISNSYQPSPERCASTCTTRQRPLPRFAPSHPRECDKC